MSDQIVTLAEAKAFVRKTDDTDLSVLELIVAATTDLFRRYTGRYLLAKVNDAVELVGSGGTGLWLPDFPVSKLTAVKEVDATGTELGLTENSDFICIYSLGRLVRTEGIWSRDYRYRITYDHGWSVGDVPADLKLAALTQIAHWWTKFQTRGWGETSRGIAGQSVQFTDEPILPVVEAVLRKHKTFRGF